MNQGVYSHILEAAQRLFCPSQVVELRAVFKNARIDSGYFDDFEALALAAATLDERGDVEGIYWTLNPVHPDCLHRAKNKIRERLTKKDGTTSDKEILERHLILIDLDAANRPTGISATQIELDAAKEKAAEIAKVLSAQKWSNPEIAMSGNGYHLLYKTQMPNDEQSAELIKAFLGTLSTLFNDEQVKIDTSVFNASRIGKVYGTLARKGDDTTERPHRRAQLLKVGR